MFLTKWSEGGPLERPVMGSGDGFPSLIVLDHGDLVIWHPEAVYGIPQHSPKEFEKTRFAKDGAAPHWGGLWN